MRKLCAAFGRVKNAITRSAMKAVARAGEAYNSALDKADNAEISRWLRDHLSHQAATVASKAMDHEYLRTHIGGGWHRLYDGGHTIAGAWAAIGKAFPDLSLLDHVGTSANEYWKDFVTTRGMPIITLDHADRIGEYFKHLDSVNAAEAIGGELAGLAIYSNWNDPAKLTALVGSAGFSGAVYANLIAPLVSLIAIGRICWLVKRSEQAQLQALLASALQGLTRNGATILLITVIPGGFLIHLSSGLVIALAHNYAWDKASESKDVILAALKETLEGLRNASITLARRSYDSAIGAIPTSLSRSA